MPAQAARPSCPSCGVAVTPGYQRCPRCHRPLPTSVRFGRVDGAPSGGATTIEPIEEPAVRWPWYLAGGAILIGAVVVIVIGSSGTRPAPALPDDPVVDEPTDESTDDVGGYDEPAPPTARPVDPGPAADRLARQMAAVRLYATVEAVGDTIDIRSSFCADDRIAGLVADVAPDLREAGVVNVRCRALHGAEAWIRPLP